MSEPHITWSKRGSARVLAASDDEITLRSSVPAPPGARLEGVLVAPPEEPVRVKSHGSKREDDGSFTIKGRLLDATRPLRERLAALAASGEPR